MTTVSSLRRAAALGFFALPVFCNSVAQAADAYYGSNTTVSTKITGSAYIGATNAANAANGIFTSPTVTFTSAASVASGITIYGGSLAFPAGCTTGSSVTVDNSGAFTMSGGTIGYGKTYNGTINVNGSGAAAISMQGGTLIGDLGSTGGTVALSGGTVDGQLIAEGASVVTFSGGSALSGLGVYDTATLNLTGSGLMVLNSAYHAPDTIYTISGKLTNNSQTQAATYTIDARDGAHLQFNGKAVTTSSAATPAPGSLSVALMGCAGIGFGIARRRRR